VSAVINVLIYGSHCSGWSIACVFTCTILYNCSRYT